MPPSICCKNCVDVVDDPIQAHLLSFLVMNFNFIGNFDKLLLLLIGWGVPLILFGIFIKADWKIPLYAVLYELIIYLFAIILLLNQKKSNPIKLNIKEK